VIKTHNIPCNVLKNFDDEEIDIILSSSDSLTMSPR